MSIILQKKKNSGDVPVYVAIAQEEIFIITVHFFKSIISSLQTQLHSMYSPVQQLGTQRNRKLKLYGFLTGETPGIIEKLF